MTKEKTFWFSAMTYGVGWGLPVAWQGWVVFSAYLLVVIAGAVRFSDIKDLFWFVPLLVVSTALLVFICWKKGPEPKLRWGDRLK